jgi:hypothetical protein
MSTPDVLYHHSHSLSLPQIMRDGFLKPLDVSKITGLSAGLPDYVHATTNAEGDDASSVSYFIRDDPELDHIRVRFTLHAEDFKPWRETVEADPRFSREIIKALAASKPGLRATPYNWFVSAENIPLTRVKAIHFKTKRDSDWREVQRPWRFVIETDDGVLGYELGSRETFETNFFEWAKTFIAKEGQESKQVMYRTLASDTYQALFAAGWEPPPEPPQDVANVYEYRTYELRTASLPLDIVKKLDKEFPLTRYSGKIDEPAEPAPLAIFNGNVKPDPFAAMASEFKPKPKLSTLNAEIMTTPIRFQIDTDLFKQYVPEEVEADKALLIAEGRWHLPNEGGRYTLRFSYIDVPECFGFPDDLTKNWLGAGGIEAKFGPGGINGPGDADVEMWIDFDMDGDKLIRTTDVLRRKVREKFLTYEKKAYVIQNPEEFGMQTSGRDAGYNYDSSSLWWEKNDWLIQRCRYDDAPPKMGEDANQAHPLIASALCDVLVLSLLDRSTVKTPSPQYDRTKPMQRPGPYNPEQEVKEVVIYCPGRISNADGTTSHASPKMHRRRGHPRTIHRGTDKQRTQYIGPMWINAGDTNTSNLPEPPVNYTVRA